MENDTCVGMLHIGSILKLSTLKTWNDWLETENYRQDSFQFPKNEIILVPVRLGGIGSSATEGYIEVLGNDGQWGGICQDSFDLLDAHVICTMIGFPTAIKALVNSDAADLYGTAPSASNFVLDNLDCSGLESSIFHCPVTGELTDICDASQIAGVNCSTSKMWQISKRFYYNTLHFFSSCSWIVLNS